MKLYFYLYYYFICSRNTWASTTVRPFVAHFLSFYDCCCCYMSKFSFVSHCWPNFITTNQPLVRNLRASLQAAFHLIFVVPLCSRFYDYQRRFYCCHVEPFFNRKLLCLKIFLLSLMPFNYFTISQCACVCVCVWRLLLSLYYNIFIFCCFCFCTPSDSRPFVCIWYKVVNKRFIT